MFLHLPCRFYSPRRSPAHNYKFKICLKPVVFTIESAGAPFSHGTPPYLKQQESQPKSSPNASEKPHATEDQQTTPKKHLFGSQNGSKNRPQRPPRASWRPPEGVFRAKNFPKALLESTLKGIENSTRNLDPISPKSRSEGGGV